MVELSREHLEFISKHFHSPCNTPEKFGEYLISKIHLHGTLCTSAMAEVNTLLNPLIEQCRSRFFCRIDDTHLFKSPASIVDKLYRAYKARLTNDGSDAGNYDLENSITLMTDLARFRIVCNFLSDIMKVSEKIENSEKLNSYFEIERKSSINHRPKDRKSGERSIKFTMEYKKSPGLFLEIQIMTQLQEAWDKKDHFLVYEKHRQAPDKDDEHFPDFLDAKMLAISELLYVADNYFDALRASREDKDNNEEVS